jgi:nucleotide-binding universal stress UspA family protein
MNTYCIALIDFSPYSATLLKVARQWAERVGVPLTLAHHVEAHVPAVAPAEVRRQMLSDAIQETKTRLRTLASETLGEDAYPINYQAFGEYLILALRQLLGENQQHLIFAGLKGAGLLKKIFLGSTIIEVINKLDQIVVAIPKDMSAGLPEVLCVGVSPKYPFNKDAFSTLLRYLAPQIKSVQFLSILEKGIDAVAADNYLQALCEEFGDRALVTAEIYQGDSALEELKRYMGRQNRAALVVQRGSRTFVDELFRKFLINELVYDGNIPLIVLP